jgi:hypothetical protein
MVCMIYRLLFCACIIVMHSTIWFNTGITMIEIHSWEVVNTMIEILIFNFQDIIWFKSVTFSVFLFLAFSFFLRIVYTMSSKLGPLNDHRCSANNCPAQVPMGTKLIHFPRPSRMICQSSLWCGMMKPPSIIKPKVSHVHLACAGPFGYYRIFVALVDV